MKNEKRFSKGDRITITLSLVQAEQLSKFIEEVRERTPAMAYLTEVDAQVVALAMSFGMSWHAGMEAKAIA